MMMIDAMTACGAMRIAMSRIVALTTATQLASVLVMPRITCCRSDDGGVAFGR